MTGEGDRIASKAARLRRIEFRLYHSNQGLRATELAAECGVDRRTIYRDLATLHDMGVPIWEDRGRYGLERSSYLSTVRLNLNEAVAILFAARLLSHHSDENNPHIASALEKLAAGIPEQTISSHLARVADQVRSRPLRAGYINAIETLTRAWADRQVVQLRYRAAGRAPTERIIEPYFLEVSRSEPAAYVIGFDRLRNDLRTFKIERIEEAIVLNEHYQIPPEFDPYQHLDSAWGVINDERVLVRLRFSAEAASRVRESVWHHSQQLRDCTDGGCELQLTVGGTREIRSWVLGWGADVEVVEPAELRAEVAAHAQRMLALYHHP